ncbi:MAG: C40 family peptidase [Bacteroidia bacterium]|nr:C40 family peptidase [Bacteroidia bacterium]MCC6767830.1 C40 family peptidase [Bacteroidia bacterium]
MLVWFIVLSSCSASRRASGSVNHQAERAKLEKKLTIKLPDTYDTKLLNCVAGWIGTPYKYGGDTQKGTDCSGLVRSIYREVYDLQIDHSAARQKENAKPLKEKQLKEGDLIFFSINSKKTDHTGIYLWNGYFVHASTRKGVLISNLSEPYYRNSYNGAGTYRP